MFVNPSCTPKKSRGNKSCHVNRYKQKRNKALSYKSYKTNLEALSLGHGFRFD